LYLWGATPWDPVCGLREQGVLVVSGPPLGL
jgi:hypothetical protein